MGEFLGRRPFTEEETITINYLKDEFTKMGLKSGSGESYFQEVPMVFKSLSKRSLNKLSFYFAFVIFLVKLIALSILN